MCSVLKCSRLTDPRFRKCEYHRAIGRSYGSRRRDKLKSTGLCVQCGVVKSRLGGTRCDKCNLTNVASSGMTYRRSRSLGKCSKCSEPSADGLVTCARHAQNRLEYVRAMKKDWADNGLCTNCGDAKNSQTTKYCRTCQQASSSRHHTYRIAAINAYGGSACACSACSEKNIKLLCIDHTNNDGNEHRKKLNRKSIYGWLKINNYPPGFQVLCFNCNIGKSLNGGTCPHLDEVQLND